MNEKPRPPPPIKSRCELNTWWSSTPGRMCVWPVTKPTPRTPASDAGFAHTPGSPHVTAAPAPPMAAERMEVSMSRDVGGGA
jgi:hypothetical protein